MNSHVISLHLLTIISVLFFNCWGYAQSSHGVSATAEAIPALVNGKNGELYQPVVFKIVNSGKAQNAKAFVDGQSMGTYTIPKDSGRLEIDVPEVQTDKEIKIKFVSDSKEIINTPVKVFPVKKWTVYLVQHTHTDIGYTKKEN